MNLVSIGTASLCIAGAGKVVEQISNSTAQKLSWAILTIASLATTTAAMVAASTHIKRAAQPQHPQGDPKNTTPEVVGIAASLIMLGIGTRFTSFYISKTPITLKLLSTASQIAQKTAMVFSLASTALLVTAVYKQTQAAIPQTPRSLIPFPSRRRFPSPDYFTTRH